MSEVSGSRSELFWTLARDLGNSLATAQNLGNVIQENKNSWSIPFFYTADKFSAANLVTTILHSLLHSLKYLAYGTYLNNFCK